MAKATVETRVLLVERSRSERFKIEVPADWKVTFGSPGGNRGGFPDEGKELRIYEAENKQRACFTGVRSFRDLSIPVTRLVVAENGTETWEDDGDGTATRTVKRSRKVKEISE